MFEFGTVEGRQVQGDPISTLLRGYGGVLARVPTLLPLGLLRGLPHRVRMNILDARREQSNPVVHASGSHQNPSAVVELQSVILESSPRHCPPHGFAMDIGVPFWTSSSGVDLNCTLRSSPSGASAVEARARVVESARSDSSSSVEFHVLHRSTFPSVDPQMHSLASPYSVEPQTNGCSSWSSSVEPHIYCSTSPLNSAVQRQVNSLTSPLNSSVQPQVHGSNSPSSVQPQVHYSTLPSSVQPQFHCSTFPSSVQPQVHCSTSFPAMPSLVHCSNSVSSVQPQVHFSNWVSSVQPQVYCSNSAFSVQPQVHCSNSVSSVQPQVHCSISPSSVQPQVHCSNWVSSMQPQVHCSNSASSVQPQVHCSNSPSSVEFHILPSTSLEPNVPPWPSSSVERQVHRWNSPSSLMDPQVLRSYHSSVDPHVPFSPSNPHSDSVGPHFLRSSHGSGHSQVLRSTLPSSVDPQVPHSISPSSSVDPQVLRSNSPSHSAGPQFLRSPQAAVHSQVFQSNFPSSLDSQVLRSTSHSSSVEPRFIPSLPTSVLSEVLQSTFPSSSSLNSQVLPSTYPTSSVEPRFFPSLHPPAHSQVLQLTFPSPSVDSQVLRSDSPNCPNSVELQLLRSPRPSVDSEVLRSTSPPPPHSVEPELVLSLHRSVHSHVLQSTFPSSPVNPQVIRFNSPSVEPQSLRSPRHSADSPVFQSIFSYPSVDSQAPQSTLPPAEDHQLLRWTAPANPVLMGVSSFSVAQQNSSPANVQFPSSTARCPTSSPPSPPISKAENSLLESRSLHCCPVKFPTTEFERALIQPGDSESAAVNLLELEQPQILRRCASNSPSSLSSSVLPSTSAPTQNCTLMNVQSLAIALDLHSSPVSSPPGECILQYCSHANSEDVKSLLLSGGFPHWCPLHSSALHPCALQSRAAGDPEQSRNRNHNSASAKSFRSAFVDPPTAVSASLADPAAHENATALKSPNRDPHPPTTAPDLSVGAHGDQNSSAAAVESQEDTDSVMEDSLSFGPADQNSSTAVAEPLLRSELEVLPSQSHDHHHRQHAQLRLPQCASGSRPAAASGSSIYGERDGKNIFEWPVKYPECRFPARPRSPDRVAEFAHDCHRQGLLKCSGDGDPIEAVNLKLSYQIVHGGCHNVIVRSRQ